MPDGAAKVDLYVSREGASEACNLSANGGTAEADALGEQDGFGREAPAGEIDEEGIDRLIARSAVIDDIEYCAVGLFGRGASTEEFFAISSSFRIV